MTAACWCVCKVWVVNQKWLLGSSPRKLLATFLWASRQLFPWCTVLGSISIYKYTGVLLIITLPVVPRTLMLVTCHWHFLFYCASHETMWHSWQFCITVSLVYNAFQVENLVKAMKWSGRSQCLRLHFTPSKLNRFGSWRMNMIRK